MITINDIRRACDEIWDADDMLPAQIEHDAMLEFLTAAYQANVVDSNTEMGFASTLSWGICIGVLAERNRQEREGD